MSIHTSPAPVLAHLHVQTRSLSPHRVVVAVAGEVDLATAPVLQTALADALATYTPAVIDVDLSACTFLDCSGITVLVAAHAAAQARGCQMWARYPQRLVRLVLEVTELLDMFTAPSDAPAPRPGDKDTAGPGAPRRLTEAVALSLAAV